MTRADAVLGEQVYTGGDIEREERIPCGLSRSEVVRSPFALGEQRYRGAKKIRLDYEFEAADICLQCRPIGNGSLFEQSQMGYFHLRSDQAPTPCTAAHIWERWRRESGR